MKKINLMDKYPVFTKEIFKKNTKIKNTDDFISILKEKINDDKIATFIAIFDHFSHTQNLGGEIVEGMINGKIIVFCFGQELPNPLAMAVRPRNIAVAEFEDKFIVSFLEAPREKANDKKISWILEDIED